MNWARTFNYYNVITEIFSLLLETSSALDGHSWAVRGRSLSPTCTKVRVAARHTFAYTPRTRETREVSRRAGDNNKEIGDINDEIKCKETK